MEKNNTDIFELLQSVVDQFDAVTKFNDGQIEINKLNLEVINSLEKRIAALEERADKLEKGVKAAKEIAICG